MPAKIPRNNRPLVHEAYQEIKRKLLTLELRPGQTIDDEYFAAELNASRTPIREALFLLAAEGLVESGKRRGFIVPALDLTDVSELLEAHIVLSKAIGRLTARRATSEELVELGELADKVDGAIANRDFLLITTSNAEFHHREAAAAHSKELGRAAVNIIDKTQRLSFLCFSGAQTEDLTNHLRDVSCEHAELIDAYRKRDTARAEHAATKHALLFRDRLQHFLQSADVAALSFRELEEAERKPVNGTAESRRGRKTALLPGRATYKS